MIPDRDSGIRERLDGLLRNCVQCGLCLPHCATYLVTGNEVQSPRGRLLLMGEWIESTGDFSVPPPADTLAAFDLCLGCRACETACPSGVAFDLLEFARERSDEAAGGLRPALARPLASGGALDVLRTAGKIGRGALRAVMGDDWRRRLANAPAPLRRLGRNLGSLPVAPEADSDLVRLLDGLCGADSAGLTPPEPIASEGRSVTMFQGCASGSLLPGTQRRLVCLLRGAGVDVRMPANQECCGALDRHVGAVDRADSRRRRNLAALAADVAETGVLLIEAAGCGLELGGYPPEIAEQVVDAAVFLSDLPLPEMRRVPLKVVLHDACHARHGQGIVDEPRRLLGRVPGLELLEPGEAEVCCGSGGPYGLFHPDISIAMGRRKAAMLAATGADLVVTTNPGCMGQIADGLALEAPKLPIIPLSDLIWYACGQP